jgi:hypothetical protein
LGLEKSQQLAVAAIVHFELTLGGAFTDDELFTHAEKYGALAADELKIMCKKRRLIVDDSSLRVPCSSLSISQPP